MASTASFNSSSLSSDSSFFLLMNCFESKVGNLVFVAFTGVNVLLLLPLCVVVLHVGYRRWSGRVPVCANTTDFISYHMVTMEMISLSISIFYCVAAFLGLYMVVMLAATHAFFVTMCGQMFLYSLKCTECYLGVVHPITYLRIKQGCGLRIRNCLVWLVWLLNCAMVNIFLLETLDFILIIYFSHQVLSLLVVCFCIFSVLRALKNPGPGEGSRDRVDQAKLRAFNSILAVTLVLLLRFGGTLVCTVLYVMPKLKYIDQCSVIFSGFWFCLPSSLMSPLLFLYRAGKLGCFKNDKGQEST